MGNSLRLLHEKIENGLHHNHHTTNESQMFNPNDVSAPNIGVLALAQDILHFEATSQVPEGLSKHVVSSKKAQSNWYIKLLQAWKDLKPPPKSPEETSRLVIATLKWHQKADVEGLLAFYNLPLPNTSIELSTEAPPTYPNGVKYELHTLPVRPLLFVWHQIDNLTFGEFIILRRLQRHKMESSFPELMPIEPTNFRVKDT